LQMVFLSSPRDKTLDSGVENGFFNNPKIET